MAVRRPPDEILEYMNRYLPEDIAVKRACVMQERFHSRLNAVRKTYRYQIETHQKRMCFERCYYYGLGQELDVGKMDRQQPSLREPMIIKASAAIRK